VTDPQLPPPSPSTQPPHGQSSHGSVPPIPAAPGAHPVTPQQTSSAPQVPGYQTPPGAYGAPVGGYPAPSGAYQAPQPEASRPATLGIIAFVLSIIAAVVAPIIGGTSAYQVGFGLPTIMNDIDTATSDLSFLSPVRDSVLLGEIGVWSGTLAGIAAIVLGIMAIAKRQGRVWGIIALILAVLGPFIFFLVVSITLTAGAGAGAVTFYGS